MKRYIRASIFSEVIHEVSNIYYFDDIEDAICQSEIAASEVLSSEEYENQYDSDLYDLQSTDEYLKSLSTEHVQKIKNLELIGRIGSLNTDMYNKLTQEQKLEFANWAKVTSRLDQEDIRHFLDMIHTCNNVVAAFPFNKKNTSFASRYNLTENDILEVLKSLTINDYDKTTISYHKFGWNHNYMIFHKSNVNISSGKVLSDVSIYIKLDVDLSDSSTVVYVSFHD